MGETVAIMAASGEGGKHGSGAGAESLYSDPQAGGRKRKTGSGLGFLNLKAHCQWHTSSNKATPPNPPWDVSPTGNQVDKYMRNRWMSFFHTPVFRRLGHLKSLDQDASSLLSKYPRVWITHWKLSKWLAWWDSLGSGLRLEKKGGFAGCVSWADTYP